MKDTLEIHLFSALWILCPSSLQNQLIPALHLHVDPMLYVKWMEPDLYAHVYQVNLVEIEEKTLRNDLILILFLIRLLWSSSRLQT